MSSSKLIARPVRFRSVLHVVRRDGPVAAGQRNRRGSYFNLPKRAMITMIDVERILHQLHLIYSGPSRARISDSTAGTNTQCLHHNDFFYSLYCIIAIITYALKVLAGNFY